MAVCSMLCTDGLLLHLVGKRQLLVYSGAPYGNGGGASALLPVSFLSAMRCWCMWQGRARASITAKLGDSIWESHHKSSAQGARVRTGQTLPHAVVRILPGPRQRGSAA